MKKTILTVLTALFLIISLTGMGNATTLTSKISMDNEFEIFISTDINSAGVSFGSGTVWTTMYEPYTTLTAGTDYYLHVWGKNFEPEGNPAGFLGEFFLSGSDHVFSNSSNSLLTNTTDWTASKIGWNVSNLTPISLGLNGVAPWNNNHKGPGKISDDAHWIWAGDENSTRDDGVLLYPANDVTYFSTQILSTSVGSPVPEPATMLLFGLGLLGVAGVSRRKNDVA